VKLWTCSCGKLALIMPDQGATLQNIQNSKATIIANHVVSPIVTVLFSIGYAIPCWIIAMEHKDAECDKPLREWLLVTAIVLLPQIVLYLIKIPFGFSQAKNGDQTPGFVVAINTIFNLLALVLGGFWFAWYILGSVWLWGYDNDQDTCPDSVKTMIFILLLIFYIGLGVLIGLCVCCCCLICCCAFGAGTYSALSDNNS